MANFMMIYEPIILLLFLFTFQSGVNSFTIYDTRLGSSSTSPTYQGRVYVLTQRGWMQVCASSWGNSESRVLCRQLGYVYSRYGRSSSSSVYALYYSFSCSGSESSISQCSYTFSYEQQTSCSNLIDVYCSPCTNGRIQIRGGVIPGAGTVEYCTSSTWKAVCDSNWDNKNAFVICRQLGFPATGAIGYQNSYFGVHPFPSSTYFSCFGNETSLSNCRSTSSSCRSDNAAGVHCRGEIITARCISGHIRLVGGRGANEGRVEICSNGVWGTVWGGGWDSNDATVVCRQLGLYQTYSRVEVFYNGYFGAGTGPILFTYLNCGGTESSLYGCTYSSYYYAASHSRDAGVRCIRTAVTVRSNCANGDVRLVNGSTPHEGRVEICYDGFWGSVCDSGWDYWDAAIVCLQMGFQGTNATALSNSHFGDGEGPYHLSGLNCRGDERTLLNCPRSPSSSTIGYHTCSPGNDAGVRCDASVCGHGNVRLFGGYSDGYGIAEVCNNGHWADICSTGSSSSLATIARAFCRQHIGQQSILSFGSQSCCTGIIRRNTGDKTLYSISCTGQSGVFIQDCSYSTVSGYSSGSCNLQNEMIVGCYESASCNAGDVRLMDGNSTSEGRVELCNQGLWGAITTSSWDSNDARVVCRQLGLRWRWALADTSNLFGRGSSRIVARNFQCSGTEAWLSSCTHTSISLSSGTSYQWYTAAGVICQGNTLVSTECNRGDVRLVNGSRETEGRVEVCPYGYNWAIVCDGGWPTAWDIGNTRLLCKQLGLPTATSEYLSDSTFESNYLLPLVGLSCNNGAGNISECQINTQPSYCNHRRTVGVFCKDQGEYYKVEIHVSPYQESHEIGSAVTLNCTVTPSPQSHDNFIFPVTYQWYFTDRGYTSMYSTRTITIAPYEQDSTDYYCLVYRGGRLLGRRRMTLQIKGVLKPSMSVSSPTKIQAVQEQRITLQVNTPNHDIADLLLGLTWYHNGSKILPRNDPRLILSSNNRTLTISNFTSSYAGVYKAQFDQLFVSPFDEQCKDEVLSLMRHYPILKPVVFCVNMDNDCTDIATETRSRKISVRSVNSALQGTFDTLTLEAGATVFSSKELDHSSIHWYRNGIRIYSTYNLQKDYDTLSLSQTFQQFNTFYEHSGRYEVLLRVNMRRYLQAGDSRSPCRSYYDNFLWSSYFGYRSEVTLAKGFIDIGYHQGLIFNLNADKKATNMNKGATLTCQASIEFPPFSMLSLIKNGQTVATSTGGMLQINTKNVNANPFGVYTCQLNASGELLHKTIQLKERVSLRMEMNTENCTKSVVEDAVVLKISRDCRCSFDKSFLLNSYIDCRGSNKLTYGAVLEYSTDIGSETASTIAERIVRQVPFSMSVGGTLLSVTSAQCTDCDATKASLSPADGGGLFFGGFIVASLIAVTLVITVVVVVKKYGLFKGKVVTRVEVKPDTVRYTNPRAPQQHQNASFNRSRAVTAPTRPRPKKPTATKPPPTPVQPLPYENMEHDGPSPIYEDV